MPRKRLRREPCDCRDCVDPLRDVGVSRADVRHAAALQDPPPKCLVVFGDGVLLPIAAGNSSAECSIFSPPDAGETGAATAADSAHPHLDGLARDGCSGLLALQLPCSSGNFPVQ